MKKRTAGLIVVLLSVALVWRTCATQRGRSHGGKPLRLATTTSVVDSGLLARLLPPFEAESGYLVDVSAVGSGRALELLAQGAADVVISHAPAAEAAALASGAATRRTPFMHNAFVVVGPKDGLATVAGAGDIREALVRIAGSGRRFFSRGDGSGTDQREKALWRLAGVSRDSSFVIATHAGMGHTLEQAAKAGGFALTDRSTYLAKKQDLDLVIVFQGDDKLANHYSVVEPASAHADRAGARRLAEYLGSPAARVIIGSFGVESVGEPLFSPE